MGLETRKAAAGGGGALSIRGASAAGANVVQVENLASGTSAADVEVRFQSFLFCFRASASFAVCVPCCLHLPPPFLRLLPTQPRLLSD